MSNDGTTLAVGAYGDQSRATGINGDDADRTASTNNAGAVQVYTRAANGQLVRQAYLKPPGGNGIVAGNAAKLGTDLVLSADGNRIIAGAPEALGVRNEFGPLGGTDYGFGAGRIAVFDRDGAGQWTMTSWNAVSDGRQSDGLGGSLAQSQDGQWLVAGATGRSFGDVTTREDYANGLTWSGAAYLFRVTPAGSLQTVARLRAPYPQAAAFYGYRVGMSGDGEWIAVGAPFENTDPATGQPVANPIESLAQASGSVHLYRRTSDGPPVFVRTLKSPAPRNLQNFGRSIDFSRDGSRLAIGADLGSLVETGNAANLPAGLYNPGPGDVYVFRREGADWVHEASLTPVRQSEYDLRFGWEVSLDASGSLLAVGMPEDTYATGAANAGRVFRGGTVRVFARQGNQWSLVETLRSVNISDKAQFGFSVALSGNGQWLATGAIDDATPGAGVNPGPGSTDDAPGGAVYLYRR